MIAVTLNVEYEAVGGTLTLAKWAASSGLVASMVKVITSPLSCSISIVWPRPSPVGLPLRISKPNTFNFTSVSKRYTKLVNFAARTLRSDGSAIGTERDAKQGGPRLRSFIEQPGCATPLMGANSVGATDHH